MITSETVSLFPNGSIGLLVAVKYSCNTGISIRGDPSSHTHLTTCFLSPGSAAEAYFLVSGGNKFSTSVQPTVLENMHNFFRKKKNGKTGPKMVYK